MKLTALFVAIFALVSCASNSDQPPAETSPLSTHAAEPAPAQVARSLSEPSAPPAEGNDAGTGHAHHAAPTEHAPHASPGPRAEQPAKSETYTCPMHPEVQQQGPGQCPQCGMNLVPRASKQGGATSTDHAAHGAH